MDVDRIIASAKLMLGASVVRLEVPDEDIRQLVYRAYAVAKPWITDRKFITVPYSPVVDLKPYGVVGIVRIYPGTRVGASGNEQMFDFESYVRIDSSGGISTDLVRTIQNSAAEDPDISFQFIDGILYLDQMLVSESITVECLIDPPLEQIQDEVVISWIQRYTEALLKGVISKIRGKFRTSNVPIELDADNLASESQSEMQQLEQELHDLQYGQLFVLR